jgi:hypothetical protein
VTTLELELVREIAARPTVRREEPRLLAIPSPNQGKFSGEPQLKTRNCPADVDFTRRSVRSSRPSATHLDD